MSRPLPGSVYSVPPPALLPSLRALVHILVESVGSLVLDLFLLLLLRTGSCQGLGTN